MEKILRVLVKEWNNASRKIFVLDNGMIEFQVMSPTCENDPGTCSICNSRVSWAKSALGGQDVPHEWVGTYVKSLRFTSVPNNVKPLVFVGELLRITITEM